MYFSLIKANISFTNFKSIIRLNAQRGHSTECHFLQHTVSLLQRKSGQDVKTESWTASSFEVDKGEKLGSGGFSTVYKAAYLGAPVAVKELAPTTSSKASIASRTTTLFDSPCPQMLMNEVAVSRFITLQMMCSMYL